MPSRRPPLAWRESTASGAVSGSSEYTSSRSVLYQCGLLEPYTVSLLTECPMKERRAYVSGAEGSLRAWKRCSRSSSGSLMLGGGSVKPRSACAASTYSGSGRSTGAMPTQSRSDGMRAPAPNAPES